MKTTNALKCWSSVSRFPAGNLSTYLNGAHSSVVTVIRMSVVDISYPDPCFGPVPGSFHNPDPLTGNPPASAIIMLRFPDVCIYWRDPHFSYFPVPAMSSVHWRMINRPGSSLPKGKLEYSLTRVCPSRRRQKTNT